MLHYYYRIICLEKDDSCGCDYGQKKNIGMKCIHL